MSACEPRSGLSFARSSTISTSLFGQVPFFDSGLNYRFQLKQHNRLKGCRHNDCVQQRHQKRMRLAFVFTSSRSYLPALAFHRDAQGQVAAFDVRSEATRSLLFVRHRD